MRDEHDVYDVTAPIAQRRLPLAPAGNRIADESKQEAVATKSLRIQLCLIGFMTSVASDICRLADEWLVQRRG
jgi:hypothetical protein